MTYEAWRIQFQSSEQAARAAFSALVKMAASVNEPCWRDLKIGEEIQAGDRCYSARKCWELLTQHHINLSPNVTKYHGPIQRRVTV